MATTVGPKDDTIETLEVDCVTAQDQHDGDGKTKVPVAAETDESTDDEGTYTRVVVIGVDGSSQSYYAVHWYITNMHKDGNFVVLTHAFELPLLHSFQEMYVSPEMWQATLRREASCTTNMERRLRGILAKYRVPGKFMARGGRPGEVLVRVAEEEDADVIVVGTRGHGKLRRAIMGTVSDYVTHHAPCPVMVCRHKGRHRTTSGSVSSLPGIASKPGSDSDKACRVRFYVEDGQTTRRPRYHSTSSTEVVEKKKEKSNLFRGMIERRRYKSESESETRDHSSDKPLISSPTS